MIASETDSRRCLAAATVARSSPATVVAGMRDPNTTGMPVDLLLVRHGQSEGNVALEAAKRGDLSHMTDEYKNRSTADYRLSALGREQAAAAGAWLRSWMADEQLESFDRLYCSTFARTRETAALLDLPRAEWQLEPLLRERDFGLWEGKAPAVISELYHHSFTSKQRNRFLWRPEGGESTPDLDMRAREVLATLAREMSHRRVLIVTHEDVMWAFRFRLEKLTVERWLEVQDDDAHDIVNCGILQYTRRSHDGPDSPVEEKFTRVRLIDPRNPDAATWQLMTRPRFSNAELLDQLEPIEPLWGE